MYKVIIDSDFEELIPNFLENRKTDVDRLKKLVLEKDYTMIGNLGHSISGVGFNYGFDFIGKIGVELQRNVATENLLEIENLIESLEKYIDNVIIEYEEM